MNTSAERIPSAAPAGEVPPAPGHYTREKWLAYRIVAKLSESGLDVHRSPAVEVWALVAGEINAWMDEHGIPRGKRPEEHDEPPAGS